MDKKPEHMSKWLEKIEEDQNVKGIDTLDDTVKNDYGRHWFLRQDIAPNLDMGVYNSTNGRFEKSHGSWRATTFSAAHPTVSNTLTAPAGHLYRVHFAYISDDFTNYQVNMTGSINGQAVAFLSLSTAMTAGVNFIAIGIPFNIDNAGGLTPAIPSVIELRSGDTAAMTITGAVGGDTIAGGWVYEDVTL